MNPRIKRYFKIKVLYYRICAKTYENRFLAHHLMLVSVFKVAASGGILALPEAMIQGHEHTKEMKIKIVKAYIKEHKHLLDA